MESDILKTIGNTPLIKIANVFAKLETTNPTGSIKDRMAIYMVNKAEENGKLKPGNKIIEITSGNTGISFSMISSIKGYEFIAVMPVSMGAEKRKIMRAFGAKIILTSAEEDMDGAMKKYNEIINQHPDAWFPRQFKNQDNIEAHRFGIGQEIIKQMNGEKIDAFVAGVGTGGTLIGTALALKEVNPYVKIIAVEPAESRVLSGGKHHSHKIEGIGEGFIPYLVKKNLSIIDKVVMIKSKDAVSMAQKLTRNYGLLVGISSGANVLAAMREAGKYKKIVTVLPDRGERYLDILT